MSRLIPLLVALIICSCLLSAHFMLCIHEQSALHAALGARQSPVAPCLLGSCLRQLP